MTLEPSIPASFLPRILGICATLHARLVLELEIHIFHYPTIKGFLLPYPLSSIPVLFPEKPLGVGLGGNDLIGAGLKKSLKGYC